ncbi:hypothetical protein GCM10009760_52720 [Kitasatospora kazusensis]|uniref:Uncharacterized protein n=1 Tax=Kitasatospora kazusensis TaxID=407974 RepID=A0ABP5LUD4_9ACTN
MDEMVPRGRGEGADEWDGTERRARCGPEVRVGVPAWRDPQRMLGGLVLSTVSPGIGFVLTRVWEHLHIAVTWR